jgi:hypothetical protein
MPRDDGADRKAIIVPTRKHVPSITHSGMPWPDVRVLSPASDQGSAPQPTVGHDKAGTGHCSLKQLMAPGIVGRFCALSGCSSTPPTCKPRPVLAATTLPSP